MSTHRGFSMPLLHSLRGGGLANEAIPWAKAFIGAEELGLRALHPPWGLNPRGYRRDFGTAPTDVVVHRALRAALPTIRITHDMVLETGETDYARAMRALAPELRIPRGRPVLVTHETMRGGWTAVRRARDFLRASFLRPRHVASDLYAVQEELHPEALTIGVHLRFGDFVRSASGPSPGIYNETLPDQWYESVVGALLDAFPGRARALLVTDDPHAPVIRRLLERPDVCLPPERSRPLLSDLLALAGADVIVCSVSAFSQLAAFLSESPYVWFAGHLNDHGGWHSIWGHEEDERHPAAVTARSLADADEDRDPVFGRGFAAAMAEPIAPELVDILERRLVLKRHARDLLYSGVVRTQPSID
jgi:hypothetical protein